MPHNPTVAVTADVNYILRFYKVTPHSRNNQCIQPQTCSMLHAHFLTPTLCA